MLAIVVVKHEEPTDPNGRMPFPEAQVARQPLKLLGDQKGIELGDIFEDLYGRHLSPRGGVQAKQSGDVQAARTSVDVHIMLRLSVSNSMPCAWAKRLRVRSLLSD